MFHENQRRFSNRRHLDRLTQQNHNHTGVELSPAFTNNIDPVVAQVLLGVNSRPDREATVSPYEALPPEVREALNQQAKMAVWMLRQANSHFATPDNVALILKTCHLNQKNSFSPYEVTIGQGFPFEERPFFFADTVVQTRTTLSTASQLVEQCPAEVIEAVATKAVLLDELPTARHRSLVKVMARSPQTLTELKSGFNFEEAYNPDLGGRLTETAIEPWFDSVIRYYSQNDRLWHMSKNSRFLKLDGPLGHLRNTEVTHPGIWGVSEHYVVRAEGPEEVDFEGDQEMDLSIYPSTEMLKLIKNEREQFFCLMVERYFKSLNLPWRFEPETLSTQLVERFQPLLSAWGFDLNEAKKLVEEQLEWFLPPRILQSFLERVNRFKDNVKGMSYQDLIAAELKVQAQESGQTKPAEGEFTNQNQQRFQNRRRIQVKKAQLELKFEGVSEPFKTRFKANKLQLRYDFDARTGQGYYTLVEAR
jgi:hypothetical protein